jgi:acyl-CoA thioesterase FadM
MIHDVGVLIMDSLIEQGCIEPREGQPCWCPDAFLEAAMHVVYCPHHGSQPDPALETLDI